MLHGKRNVKLTLLAFPVNSKDQSAPHIFVELFTNHNNPWNKIAYLFIDLEVAIES